MNALENVKKGIQCCLPRDEEQCWKCPYFGVGCYDARIAETLECFDHLEAEREALLEALKEMDVFGECRQCIHRKEDVSPECEAAECDCAACTADCTCAGCVNGSRWQWKGLNDQGG